MKLNRVNKKKILLIVVSIFIIVALCVGLIFFALKDDSSSQEKEDPNIAVSSPEEAAAQLKELGDDFGYENALSELTEKSTTTIDGDTYYRLQQNYQGIPVYGRTVVYVTDENGEAITITGNVLDVGENINANPTITVEELTAEITAYAVDMLGFSPDDCVLNILSYELVWYVDSSDHTALAYRVWAYIGGDPYDVVVDANTGDVYALSYQMMTESVSVSMSVDGYEHEINLWQENDGSYITYDAESNIRVLSANGETLVKVLVFKLATGEEYRYNCYTETWYDEHGTICTMPTDPYVSLAIEFTTEENLVGVTQPTFADLEILDQDACGMLFFTTVANDYFSQVLSRDGWGDGDTATLQVVFDCANGSYHYSPKYGVSMLSIESGSSLNTVAHELTHAMESTESGMTYSGESGAIMEALSDIFAEIVEYDLLGECDWLFDSGLRNLINPSLSTGDNGAHPTIYEGEYWYDTTGKWDSGGVHNNSTVISHSAYLMSKDGGGLLTMNELAKLWYRAMLMMPSDCDFAECRTMVELAAVSMGLSDAQIACVKEAFNTVGISNGETVDYELNSSATLSVHGADSDLHSNYTMQISGTQTIWNQDADPTTDDIYNYYIYFRQNTTAEKYYETRHITTAESVPLDLKYGAYTITLIDDEGIGTSVSFKIKVGARDGKDNLDIYTDFGKGSSNNSSLTENSFAVVVEQCIEKCAYYSLSDEQQQVCRGLLHDLNDDGQEELILLFLCDSNMAYEVWSFVDGTVTCVASSMTESGLIYQNLGIGVGTYKENKYLVCMWEEIDQSSKFAELEYIYKVTNGVYELSDTVNSYDLDNISALLVVMYPEYQGGMTLPNLLADLQGENTQTETNAELVDAVCLNGHYYKVYNGQSSWEDAAAFCQSVGGHLATITSEEENTFLYNYLVSMGLSGAYFGLSDVNMEGNWVWCTGEEVTFTNWDSGEPNNEGRKEHYGLFDFSHNDGKWNDGSYRSGTDTNFVCEWDAVVSPDTGNDESTKTVYLLKQAVTYSVDYDNQPSKTKTFLYNQDGQLTEVASEIVSKQTEYGETSYEEQLLEYYLECNKSGYYSGFSASLDGSNLGKGTISCDANGRILEFYSTGTGQKHSFSYNADGLICEYIYEYNGEVYTHSKMQYDSRGNIVFTERIQRDGSKTESRTEIEYDVGDGLIMMTQYVNGVEQNSILQRCDTYGNVMKEEHYKDGTLVGWIEYTYETQTVPGSWQKLPDLILSLLGG